jgi:excisionase family DNA binding protein
MKERTMEAATREVLNVEQAAELLGFSPYTIREKARLGEIPGRKTGREWRFSRTALLDWLREDEVPRRRAPVVELTPDPDGRGYVATIQGVPDIRSTGQTADEAVHNIMAALEASSYANKYRTELPD